MVRVFIDTSSERLSIVIKRDEDIISSYCVIAGKKMSELVLLVLDNVFSNIMMDISEVDEFYAITGPGSFTGVRIGVSLILGFSEGLQKPAFGLTSLDMAALASGKDVVKVASRLKGDIFAVRSYDFCGNLFSDYESVEIAERDLGDYLLVNSSPEDFLQLDKALKDDRFLGFKCACAPIYLRKPEAELEFDNKGGC